MALRRTKRPDIYNVTSRFFESGSVQYVAHAILKDGTAILLRPTLIGVGGGNAFNHPDQAYWRLGVVAITNAIQAHAGNVKRNEIDCTLMPCNKMGGCRSTVPALIRSRYQMLSNVALRVFSHRSEFAEASFHKRVDSSKRYFDMQITTKQLSDRLCAGRAVAAAN